MRTISPLRPSDPRQLGAYRVLGRIGKGGQGEVFLAERNPGERVAVKVLNAESWSDERAQRMFMREVALAKQVARFCTAQVIDAGMVGAQPYLVSEFIDGPALAEKVAQDGPVSGSALERLAIGTATALTAIHQAGIVHRDFKPGNVLIGPDGPRVIDFGIARELGSTATATSQIMGTPAYISPEQIAGSPAGAPSDVFAWGVTMAYAATGAAPFGQDSIPAVINRVLNETPDLSGIQAPLRELVERCLDKNPNARPTAQEILLTLLGGRPTDLQTAAALVPPARRFFGLRALLATAVALVVGGAVGATAVRPWTLQAASAGAQTITVVTTQPSPAPTSSPSPTLPPLTGLPVKDALAKLGPAGLTQGKIVLDCAGGGAPGRVLRAALLPGTRTADLVVSAAKARVPDARGWPLKQGKAAVEKVGFTVKVGFKQGRDWVGKVAAVRPAPGANACVGSEVELSIGVK